MAWRCLATLNGLPGQLKEEVINIKRLTVIIPTDYLDEFEKCLRVAGVPGMTIDNVRGFATESHVSAGILVIESIDRLIALKT